MPDTDDLDDTIDAMIEAGRELPSDLEQRLVDWEGDEATDRLLQVALDDELSQRDARGDGWGPIHAVDILYERGDVEAVEPLARRLFDVEPGEYLHDRLILGVRALEDERVHRRILDVFDEARDRGDGETMRSLLEAALETGAVSDRLSEAFAELAEWKPDFVDQFVHDYEAADDVVAHLEDRLDEVAAADEAALDGPASISTVTEVALRLSADVPEPLTAGLERPTTTSAPSDPPPTGNPSANSVQSETFVDDSPDVGRNDPCPCGSGRKYKKCCLHD